MKFMFVMTVVFVSLLENKRRQVWFCCHVVRRVQYLEQFAGIHYDTNMDRLTITRQHYDNKPNIVVFYSLSNAFDKYRSKYFEMNMGHSRLLVEEPILMLIHANRTTAHCHLRTAW